MRARGTESVCPCPLPSVSDFSLMEACMESKARFYKAKSNKDLNNPDMVCVREGRGLRERTRKRVAAQNPVLKV